MDNDGLPTIYIPTIGRSEKQHTYEMLPNFLKEKVIFVVRESEKRFFKNHIICPSWVENVGTTRKFVQQVAGDTYHWVMDDDLKQLWLRFFDATPGREEKLLKFSATEETWRELVKDTYDLITSGYGLITYSELGFIPSHKRYPFKTGLCGAQWFAMSGALTKHLQWDRQLLHEDVDFCLQAITSGVKVARFEKYVFGMGPLGAPGGCATFRTPEMYEEQMKLLMKRWPRYVRPRRPRKNYGKEPRYQDGALNLVQKFYVQAFKDNNRSGRSSTSPESKS